MASWRTGARRGGQLIAPPPTFELVGKKFGTFTSKNADFCAEDFPFGGFNDKIENSITHKFSVAALCRRKIANTCARYFVNPRRRGSMQGVPLSFRLKFSTSSNSDHLRNLVHSVVNS